MTLENVRREMNAFWDLANREAEEFKDSFLALQRVDRMYRSLSTPDRERANEVLAEWALSDEEAKRFDAVALIREFQVVTAAPALRELGRRLARGTDPGAPFEREKVEGLLRELGVSRDKSP